MIDAIQPPQSKQQQSTQQQQSIEQSPENKSAGFRLSKIQMAVLSIVILCVSLAAFGFFGWDLLLSQRKPAPQVKGATVLTCDSCQDCQTKINNNAQPGDTIKLMQDLDFTGAGIVPPNLAVCLSLNNDNLTIDCNGKTITNQGINDAVAVHMPNDGGIVKNCSIHSFEDGIMIDYGASTLENNQDISNNQYGIYIYSYGELVQVVLNNNKSCSNTASDIYIDPAQAHQITFNGTNNTCDKATNYHDDGKSGCTNACTAPPPGNNPPTISQALSANPKTVDSGGQSVLTITANDADAGDKLSYTWQEIFHNLNISACNQSNIDLNTEIKCTVTFPPVAADTDYKFKVKVSDGKASVFSNEEKVTVKAPQANAPPEITKISADPPKVLSNGGISTLSVIATDDKDPPNALKYTWTKLTPNTICPIASNLNNCKDRDNCQVTFGAVTQETKCVFNFNIEVKDSGDLTDSGAVIVTVSLFLEICDNAIDDDSDGKIDCQDPDCCVDPICKNSPDCNLPPKIVSLAAERTDLNGNLTQLQDVDEQYLDDHKSRKGDSIALKVNAVDPNGNINITDDSCYSWTITSPSGTVSTPSGQKISFNITEVGDYKMMIKVSDTLGESDSREWTIESILNNPPQFTNWQSISLIRELPPDYKDQYKVKLVDDGSGNNRLVTTDAIPTVYTPDLAYNFVKYSDKLYVSNVEVTDSEGDDLTYSWFYSLDNESSFKDLIGQTNKELTLLIKETLADPDYPYWVKLKTEDPYGGLIEGMIKLPVLNSTDYKVDVVSINGQTGGSINLDIDAGTQLQLTPALDPLLEPEGKMSKKWEYLFDQWNAHNPNLSALPPESINFKPGPFSLIVNLKPPAQYPSGQPITDYILPIKLTVTDPYTQTDSQDVLLNVTVTPQPGNQPPTAVIQKTSPAETIDPNNPDFTVWGNTAVKLDGSYSHSNPDGTALTYQWSELSQQIPDKPKTAIFNFTSPNKTTELVIQLIVNDGKQDSAPALFEIAVYKKSGSIVFHLINGDNYIVFPYEPANLSLTTQDIIDASAGSISLIANLSNSTSTKIRAGWVYQMTVNNIGGYDLSYDYASAAPPDSKTYLTPDNFQPGSTGIVWVPETSKSLSYLQSRLGLDISVEEYGITTDLNLDNLDTFAFQDGSFNSNFAPVAAGIGWETNPDPAVGDQICALIPLYAKDNPKDNPPAPTPDPNDELEVYIKDNQSQESAWKDFDVLEEEKPKVVEVEIIPPDGAVNVCRNAQIKLKFNQLMDQSTLRYATGMDDTITITAKDASMGLPITCSGPGAPITFNNFNKPWHQKIFNFLARLFGRARAQITECYFQKVVTETNEGNIKKTVVLLMPVDSAGRSVLLAPDADYTITVAGDQDGVHGLPNQYGFFGTMAVDKVSAFKTGAEDNICLLDHIEVTPNPWYFYQKNSPPKDFTATSYANNGTVIGAVVGQYEWEFAWSKVESKQNLITLTETTNDTVAQIANETNQEGNATVKATATITVVDPKLLVNDRVGRQVVGKANIYVIMCQGGGEYLWIYQDSGKKSNFQLAYCRTGANGEYLNNPLPPLMQNPMTLSPEESYREGLLVEYFLLYDQSQIGSYTKSATDEFLLRAFPANEYFISAKGKSSLEKWYEDNEEAFCEETEEKKCEESARLTMGEDIDDYLAGKAGAKGNKVYAQALNVDLDQPRIYSNIYVLAINENADQGDQKGATRDIFNQMIKNWRFNINISDSENIDKLKKDYQRIQDLSLISSKLDDYYHRGARYPTLKKTKGIAASVWDWEWRTTYNDERISLSKVLNMNLPLDPNDAFPRNIKSTEKSGILEQIAKILPDCLEDCAGEDWGQVYDQLWGADSTLDLPLKCLDDSQRGQNLFAAFGLGYGKTADQPNVKDPYEIFRCYNDEHDDAQTDMYYCQDSEPSIYQYETNAEGSVFALYARLEYNNLQAWCNGRTEADCRKWTGEAGFCVWNSDECKLRTVDAPDCDRAGIMPFNIMFDSKLNN